MKPPNIFHFFIRKTHKNNKHKNKAARLFSIQRDGAHAVSSSGDKRACCPYEPVISYIKRLLSLRDSREIIVKSVESHKNHI